MKEDDNNLTLVVIIFWIMMSLLVLSSCSATREFAQPSSSTQRYEVSRDTIYQRDSIYVNTHTIIREADSSALAAMGIQLNNMNRSWIIKVESLHREIHSLQSSSSDTIYITDTIWQPYEVEKIVEVPAKLTWHEEMFVSIGRYTLIAALCFIVFIILKYWLKLKCK